MTRLLAAFASFFHVLTFFYLKMADFRGAFPHFFQAMDS